MVFYDGGFFRHGQIYFNYNEGRGWFSLPQLHITLEKYVASKIKTPVEITKVVGAHYYDGRPSTNVADSDSLEKDRKFEMSLISAGVVPHYLALSEKLKGSPPEESYYLMQKGVDVKLALDALDFAHDNRFDVAVLIAGDGDFVPLVRKVTSLGKQVLVAYFEFDSWKDNIGKNHKPCYVSRELIDAATASLNFNQLVKDRDWKSEIRSLFFKPKTSE
ncbi:MAG: NYN domain-containing protein [Candidatus Omnitrophica bacterium]|nr:NYN domain-containing protein [Candidatus Omnitrophota bacterium]